MDAAKTSLPFSLYLKSRIIGSPLERAGMFVKKLSFRLQHPDLWELVVEGDRLPLVLKKLLPPAANCIDVGCHIGSFLNMILKLFPEGKHLAVEASKSKSGWLKKKFPATAIYSVAAGEQTGTDVFEENLKQPGYSRLLGPSQKTDGKLYYEVEVRRIDDIVPADLWIDLLKLDVEGFELPAIRGAISTIKRCHPVIMFESGAEESMLKQGVNPKDLFDFLTTTLGYSIYTFTDMLFDKGPISFHEFRKCGLYPYRTFNFVAVYHQFPDPAGTSV